METVLSSKSKLNPMKAGGRSDWMVFWRIWRFLLTIIVLALLRMTASAQTTIKVADYGAIGDAVQFYVNTVSNSPVLITTSHLSSADIGKAIEVFGVGTWNSGVNSYGGIGGNQDIVATITNVVNGTNIYISAVSQVTLNNTFATYGHDNSVAFQNALDAASGPNTIISIPAGKFLMLTRINHVPAGNGRCPSALVCNKGGFHLVGAGMTNTVLLGQGAWMIPPYVDDDGNTNTWCTRGFLFAYVPPLTNDYPVSFENLTMDGGVAQGNISVHGMRANDTDGLGWDWSHSAIIDYGQGGMVPTHQLWTNIMVTHWRGEMMKGNDSSTNGNVTAVNCVFSDGDATALNYYSSMNVTNCLFSNMFQIAEYFQAFNTNICYFQGNTCTNVTGNGFAVNGGRYDAPAMIISNNTFYCSGGNMVLTTPGDNIFIVSNKFISVATDRLAIGIALGTQGYQSPSSAINSNIVMTGNSFIGMNIVLSVLGGDASSIERVESWKFENNKIYGGAGVVGLNAGWTANYVYRNNDFSGVVNGYPTLNSGNGGTEYILVETNNEYFSGIRAPMGGTNIISYANGSRYEIWYSMPAGTVWALQSSDSNQIPAGAQIMLHNANWSGLGATVYLNDAFSQGPITIQSGDIATFDWNGTAWVSDNSVGGSTNSVVRPSAPSALRILN